MFFPLPLHHHHHNPSQLNPSKLDRIIALFDHHLHQYHLFHNHHSARKLTLSHNQ